MALIDLVSTLSPLLGLCAVFSLSLCYVLGLAIYRVYFHPLAAYPGPKLCAISRIPYVVARIQGLQIRFVRGLHEAYGEVVRIAPNELSYISSEAVKDIYGHRIGKSEMAKVRLNYAKQAGGDHIINADRADHSRFRKHLSHGFSDSSMRQQEPLIQRYVTLLMQRLEEHSRDGQVLDLSTWYNWITFDIIGDLTFGEPFGCLQNADYHPWVSIVFDFVKVSSRIGSLAFLPFGKYAPLLVPKRILAKSNLHRQLTLEKVTYRTQLAEERPDFLGHILKRKESGFTFPELLSNSSILILAGSETTATMLAGLTYLLLSHPNALAKAADEVRSSFGSMDEITINTTTALKYLIACIEEGLRLYPPAPTGFSRYVPDGGDFIAGNWVPSGTIAGVSILSAHRSSRNFHEPDSYIPERFLNDPRFVNDNMGAFIPFSTGPRNCVGKNLAWAEMRVIMAKMLFKFDWELALESKNWMDQKSYGIWERGPLYVKLKKVAT